MLLLQVCELMLQLVLYLLTPAVHLTQWDTNVYQRALILLIFNIRHNMGMNNVINCFFILIVCKLIIFSEESLEQVDFYHTPFPMKVAALQ